MKRALAVVMGAALLAAVPATATAAPPENSADPAPQRAHDLPNPLGDQQREERAAGLEKVLSGEAVARGANKVVQLGRGKYVELAREDEDAIWTVLGEFTDLPHNQIPEPDRRVDNTTIWTEDFSRDYFDRMLYSSADGVNSVANFYEEQSSGRYSVTGEVEDWVTLGGEPAAYYGEGDDDRRTWEFLEETLDAWYQEQLDAGKTTAQIDEYLAQYDVWDRYDFDQDGNFDEADGYIDHFQAVHSGMGEEVGGGALGADAIWSHRWYVNSAGEGTEGPQLADGTQVALGGTQVGQSRYWIGDYTVEPENGGVGVFAHEFGHDLGLPDLYDTSGNSGGAENSTAFWTLMSSGSYGNSGRPEDGIGTKPIPMGAWEKLQLNWLNYEVVEYGKRRTVQLGPAAYNTRQKQALITLLPDREVTTTIGAPFEGNDFWYSGSGDDLDNTMLVAKPAGASTLTAKVSYEIEEGWDYAYAGYVDGARFVPLPTNIPTDDDPNGQNAGYGITGSTDGAWVDLTVDVSTVPDGAPIGFRYWTDGAAAEKGLLVDATAVDGTPVAEWALDGFTETAGTTVESHFNAYIAENRAYTGYDTGLRTGPYNFGDPTRPDWAERLPYQDGLLISYWNSQYTDNNVGAHPGAGLILPVDAHAELLYEPTDDEGTDRTDGESWRPRIQSYDSTFGWQPTDRITLHDPDTGVERRYGGLLPVPSFDDREDWYVAPGEQPDANGWTGVDVPKTGTRISVLIQNPRNNITTVHVG
ncbi:immune inhibitor A domain-containing protein [Blastococcus litoris]|uniref:immune inhibitor A domain-containing protein n=1 Tax=Blastococcus litoris TaxID=2171622 RepID=UPI000E306E6E|nr:immune inhibitor A domain-containing protein [Blastococcus litoris]